MKKAVSVCNTSMQILNTINLKVNHYADCDFDLIITSQIANCKDLFENASKANVFANVYLFDNKEFYHNGKLCIPTHSKKYARKLVKSLLPCLEFDYDLFFCNNFDKFINLFCFAQKKKLQIIWFDEGLGSYTAQGDFINTRTKNPLRNFVRLVLNLYYVNNKVNLQFLYHPELVSYTVPFERKKLFPLTKNKELIRDFANKVFGFKADTLLSRKFIYFEQPYKRLGSGGNDYELIEKVASVVGKNNLTVKVHPSSTLDSFKDFNTNQATEIPWELYILNDENYDNCLISVMSSSIFSPFLLFDIKKPVICLYNCFDKSLFSVSSLKNGEYIIENIIKKNPDVFIMPDSIDELKLYLQETIVHTIME